MLHAFKFKKLNKKRNTKKYKKNKNTTQPTLDIFDLNYHWSRQLSLRWVFKPLVSWAVSWYAVVCNYMSACRLLWRWGVSELRQHKYCLTASSRVHSLCSTNYAHDKLQIQNRTPSLLIKLMKFINSLMTFTGTDPSASLRNTDEGYFHTVPATKFSLLTFVLFKMRLGWSNHKWSAKTQDQERHAWDKASRECQPSWVWALLMPMSQSLKLPSSRRHENLTQLGPLWWDTKEASSFTLASHHWTDHLCWDHPWWILEGSLASKTCCPCKMKHLQHISYI